MFAEVSARGQKSRVIQPGPALQQPLAVQFIDQRDLRAGALRAVARSAEELQVLDAIGSSAGTRNNVVNFEISVSEGDTASIAATPLFPEKHVFVCAITGEKLLGSKSRCTVLRGRSLTIVSDGGVRKETERIQALQTLVSAALTGDSRAVDC